jgi:PEP-CTERM motif
MKLRHAIFLIGLAALPARATIIQLELYNSYPLVNSDGITPLAGNSSAGDLVQVIATGPDDAINAPSGSTGLPSGDDTVLFTLHVGTGIPTSGTGLLDAYPLDYSSTLVDSNFYVRFWNGTTVADSTDYGNSAIFELPAGDAFNQASLDFVPTSGSPHTTDQPFSLNVVPEPSSLFLFGFVVLGVWMWKRRRQLGIVTVIGGLLLGAHNASAQFAPPQDVYNSVPMLNAYGAALPGNTDPANSNDCTVIPGCLVEILQVGSNGVAHVANLDGSPSGGDSILFSTFVGEGILVPPCDSAGVFSTSFDSPPNGTKIYARVFNAPSTAQATAWGQSADFTTDGSSEMDLSLLGLKATTMPEGVNLATIDSKGVSYFSELVANTNPQNPTDLFVTGAIVQTNSTVEVNVTGHVGRMYTLQRSTDMAIWSNVTGSATGVLPADTSLMLADPHPPASPQLFYRVDVTMP